ncbi:GNAT family N-acetyltransferase [Deinococcus apachensis]|uniref:GNAT family N-acetyltransferase n=1 Tax=Deinococcus apachensis TaxID=309886 RepID=UPI00036D0BC9|nr:hypothetical protein [Deinococcus apachensis]
MNGPTAGEARGNGDVQVMPPEAPSLEILAGMRADLYARLGEGYGSLPPEVRTRLGIEQVDFGVGVLELVRSLPHPAFNLVRGFGIAAPATEADLDALLVTVEQARPPAWGLPLDPRTRPADLAARLEARGLREVFREVALYAPAPVARRALETSTPPFPKAVQADPDQAGEVASFISEHFGMPPEMTELVHFGLSQLGWLGYLVPGEGGPISAGLLMVGGPAALLNSSVTRPDRRGQGGQTALILRRLREGLARGCEHFFVDVEAGPDNPSRRNLERLGFRPVFEVPVYTGVEPGA